MNETDFIVLNEKIWTSGARRDDLVQRVANALREQIVEGQLAAGSKFIPEAELAKLLNISRPSLREAIRILAHEGLIQVKHGVGTFVSKTRKPMIGSLELMRSMTDLIREAGGEPAHRDLKIERQTASQDTAEALEIEQGSDIGCITRVRLINDSPFVYAREYVVLDDAERDFGKLSSFSGGSLYQFLRDTLGRRVSHSKVKISAVAAENAIAQLLGLKKGAPLLLMNELHFGSDGKPLLLAVNYHNTEVVEFTSMRSGMPI